MKGIGLALQIECDCGALVETVSQTPGNTPMLKSFESSCQCGRKFFTHVQQTKGRDK